MKAIGFNHYGHIDVLRFMDVEKPDPKPNDIIVKVKAVGINPIDEKAVRGWHVQLDIGDPAPGTVVENGPKIPGWDGTGIVEEIGSNVSRFSPGDEVYFAGDLSRQGSCAEFIAIDNRIVAPKPESLGYEQAAAVPLTALTAWEGLFERMGIMEKENGRSLLIVGGAGGVGSIAIQLAKQLTDLKVIATASSDESKKFCRKMGADHIIDHSKPLLAQLKKDGFEGADYIYNTYDPRIIPQLSEVLNPFGKICLILPSITPIDNKTMVDLFFKSATITYELMFTRPVYGVEPEKQGEILEKVGKLFDSNKLMSRASQILSWTDFKKAHQQIKTTHTIGKIVMKID